MNKKTKWKLLSTILTTTSVISGILPFVSSCSSDTNNTINPDTNINTQNALQQEKDKINNCDIQLKPNLSEEEINKIDKNNLLNYLVNINTNDSKFKYEINHFNKNESSISFTIKISKDNQSVETRLFTIDITQQPLTKKPTVIKSNLTAAQFNLNEKTVDEIIQNNIISSQWFYNNKNILISGDNNITNPNQITISNITKGVDNTSLTFNVVLDANSWYKDDGNLSSVSSDVTIVTINGFKQTINPNPEKPTSDAKHSLSYNNIKTLNSPVEIIKQTPKYKKDYQRVLGILEGKDGGLGGKGSANFVYNVGSKQLTEEFFEANKDIGIYGDYGTTLEEKMHYSPTIELPGHFTMQVYADKFQTSESNSAIKSQKNIDEIIKWNPFGFLPSNLSQLFYYLDLESISNIFSIPNIKEIKINFDDEQGTLDVLLTDTNSKKYIFNYSSIDKNTTIALKRNKDFRQYIYDRTVRILTPSLVELKPITFPKKQLPLQSLPDSGTGFVIDRVLDKNLKQDEYEFLVATNMHVLDFSKSYNKSRSNATSILNFSTAYQESWKPSDFQKLYNENFDGGSYYKGGINGVGRDQIVSVQGYGIQYGKFTQRNTDPNNLMPLKLQKPHEKDVDKVIDQGQLQLYSPETNINRKNLIDAVWYTPEFKTSGVWSTKDILHPVFDVDINNLKNPENIAENYTEWESRYTGTISNAGADFVITKIILSKEEIKQVLPTLYDVLDTPQEKDWYIGIGDDNAETEVAANSTLFTGGFPEGIYKSRKWNSGRIQAQKRFIPNEIDDPFSIQHYWTRYDEILNKKFNSYRGLVDWYKYTDMKFLSMSEEQNRIFNPKGMQIQKILQFPLFVASDNGSINDKDTLHGGASGSMVINSRFELVGSLFGYKIWSEDNKSQSNNFFQIFKQYTEENRNFSIIQQIKERLVKEGLTTVKLKPS